MPPNAKRAPPGRDDAREDQLARSIKHTHNAGTVARQAQPALRPYQAEGVESVRASYATGNRRVLYVLPTGGGKTHIFSEVARRVTERGRRALVLAHRQEIVDQIDAALDAAGVPHGMIVAGKPETADAVQLASVATLARRLDYDRSPFDLIVIDEAHHAVAGSWGAILKANNRAFLLGVTATPERLDGRGLGDVFSEMVVGPDTSELIAQKFLVPPIVYAPESALDLSGVRTRHGDYASDDLAEVMATPQLIGDAVDHYRRHAAGLRALVFCSGVEHSRVVRERFTIAGFRAAHVDGRTPRDERRSLIAALGSGEIDLLTNAGLFSEGVDVPGVGAVLMLRPTQSLSLYLQMVGRALRPAPGKDRAIVLDHAANCRRHGLPDAPRSWSLDGKARRDTNRQSSPRLRRCSSCGALNAPLSPTCQACGDALQPLPVEIREAEAQLVEQRRRVEHERLRRMPYRDLVNWASTRERAELVARVRGFKPGWVHYRLQEIGRA